MQITITGNSIQEIIRGLGIMRPEAGETHGMPKPKPESSVWSDIKYLVNSHNENALRVGEEYADEDGTVYQVAHIDQEEHGVIFVRKCALPDKHVMNEEWTNEGGWASCQMREHLEEEVFPALSDELRAVISPRTYKVSKGGKQNVVDTVTDYLFLPREGDVFSTRYYSTQVECLDCTQWELFRKTRERVRTQGDDEGNAIRWWLASPIAGAASDFCDVTAAGAACYNSAGGAYGVLPCFLIAPSES